eukprot:CAMPEP_0174276368 /NCGR_PEP_ID=MMETSP0439-20130205/60344_1 /TAXON_ID=0 /ORGANISM="Stereomyxa ramosa, Strain Chinc5" /LENGTH=53 /DNA_ID=CAMNT_0015368581 /DNA_START=920 /DNA_END=1078 /DNA_ORIENTATION=-
MTSWLASWKSEDELQHLLGPSKVLDEQHVRTQLLDLAISNLRQMHFVGLTDRW